MPVPTDPVRVIYLVGAARSGTTLLSRILHAVPECTAIGETVWLGDPIRQVLPCGCGLPHDQCDEWREIVDELRSPGAAADWSALASGLRPRHLTAYARRGLDRPSKPATGVLKATFERIAARHPGHILVDESKPAWFGYVLSQQPWADVSFVEIVRHPSDVVDSWLRGKDYLPSADPAMIARQWIRAHATASIVRRRSNAAWCRVPFEDILSRPDEVVRAVLGVPTDTLSREDSGWAFDALANHIYASNPDKAHRGREILRAPSQSERTAPRSVSESLAVRYWRTIRPTTIGGAADD